MKHEDKDISDLFLSIFASHGRETFMVTDGGRYAVVMKVDKDMATHPDRRSPRGLLCVYDAEDVSIGPLFKVTDRGVLGYHGSKPHIANQVLLLKSIMAEAHTYFVLGHKG